MTRQRIAILTVLAALAAGVAGAQGGDTPSPAELLKQINNRLLAWDTAGARALFEQLPDRGTVPARVAAGRLLAQEKKLDQAVEELARAREAAPGNPEPALWLGETHLAADRADEARDAFTRAAERAEAGLAATPDDVRLLLVLGTARQRLRLLPEATTALERARELAPGNAEVAYQLGATLAMAKDWGRAVEVLSSAIERNAELAHAYYVRALAAEKIDRKDLLINDLERFLALAPEAPEAPRARRLLDAIRG